MRGVQRINERERVETVSRRSVALGKERETIEDRSNFQRGAAMLCFSRFSASSSRESIFVLVFQNSGLDDEKLLG